MQLYNITAAILTIILMEVLICVIFLAQGRKWYSHFAADSTD